MSRHIDNRTDEYAMAKVVAAVLRRRKVKAATQEEVRDIIRKNMCLTRADMAKSPSRSGERLWEQVARNIKSHIGYHEEFKKYKDGGIALVGYDDDSANGFDHKAAKHA